MTELLGGKVATAKIDHPIRNDPQTNGEVPGYEDGFVIGEDEEESEGIEGPPVYDNVDFSTTVDRASPNKENDAVKAEQGSIHYLRPEETLSGLALKYRLDVSLFQ